MEVEEDRTHSESPLVSRLASFDSLVEKLAPLGDDEVLELARVLLSLRRQVRVGLERVLDERLARLRARETARCTRSARGARRAAPSGRGRTRANQIVRFLWWTFMRKKTMRDWRYPRMLLTTRRSPML